jgi:membrane protease YdiL (CAAX protease family)
MDEANENSEGPADNEAETGEVHPDSIAADLIHEAATREPKPWRMTLVALAFEGGLGGLALAVGWLLNHGAAVGMQFTAESAPQQLVAIVWGLAATLPLLVALLLLDRFPIGPIQSVKDVARELIERMFRGASVVHLAVISLAAGCGEELLFRGLAQAGLARLIGGEGGPWAALAIASVLFGVCHWLNTTYAILAMLAGLYFGFLLILTGNLWTPIMAHAAYDFIALLYLVRPNHLVRSSI